MPLKTIGTGRTLMGGGTYADKVLGHGPIAYWPLWETRGTVASCLVNPAQNGTYSSDVSTWPVGTGIGDGNAAPQFDGANDYTDVETVAFKAAFDGTEGTFAGWARVANAGVWTDGAFRRICNFYTDGNNQTFVRKNDVNNQMLYYYEANNVPNARNVAYSATAWFHVAITWSDSANQVRTYLNGVEQGAAMAPDVWAGVMTIDLLGASNGVPTNPWQGGMAHWVVFDRPFVPASILDLATV